MLDVIPILQAFLAPSIFISAAALLLLSLNTRLMGIVARLRQLHREGHQATLAGRAEEATAFAEQIASVERRAGQIRRAFLSTLVCLAGTIMTCFLLGIGLYWPPARLVALASFVAAMIALLVGVFAYLSEVLVSLSAVREEARFFQLVDPPHAVPRQAERRSTDFPSGM